MAKRKGKLSGFKPRTNSNYTRPSFELSPEPEPQVTPEPPNLYPQPDPLHQLPDSSNGSWSEEDIRAKVEALNRKNTNLVFTFGYMGSSKTTVLAALNIYLEENYLVTINTSDDNLEANKLLKKMQRALRKYTFPPVTHVNKLFEYDIACRKSRDDNYLNLTFIEMSGEKQKDISMEHGHGRLPKEVEIYLKENELPILIFLVISYDELVNDDTNQNYVDRDSLARDFINYLEDNQINCVNVGIIISKFDRDKVPDGKLEDITPKLKTTLRQIEALTGSYKVFPFSVGEVAVGEGQYGRDKIKKLDLGDCEPIIQWVFESFPNDFTKKSSSKGRSKRFKLF